MNFNTLNVVQQGMHIDGTVPLAYKKMLLSIKGELKFPSRYVNVHVFILAKHSKRYGK